MGHSSFLESRFSGSLRCADCSTAKSLALVCESHGENAHTPVPSDEKEQGTPAASLAPDALETTPPLDHERLDVFRVALEFLDHSTAWTAPGQSRWRSFVAAMVPTLTKAARPALRDQIVRASSSIALLVAEGNTPFPQVGWAQTLDARVVIATTSSRWLILLGKPASRPRPPHRSFGPCVRDVVRRFGRRPPVPSTGWRRGT